MTPPPDPGERLRVLIVDDEALARQAVRTVVEQDPELAVAGECADGHQALEAFARTRPHVLILDIQMPEMDGIEVLRRLAAAPLPAVVFVTAYDDYAVAAFEQQALDYVLKPFPEHRLQAAVDRAKARVRGDSLSAFGQRVMKLIGTSAAPAPRNLERLTVTRGDRTVFLEIDRVDWLEAADYYVRVHTEGSHHLVRRSLKWFEAHLDPQRFVRVHRSAIVRVARIRELRRLGPGDHVVVLSDDRQIPLSRAGREALARLLG